MDNEMRIQLAVSVAVGIAASGFKGAPRMMAREAILVVAEITKQVAEEWPAEAGDPETER